MKEKIFEVEIEETLQRVIKVKATNEDEAIDIVTKRYKNEEIVLDSDDFMDYDIHLFTDEVNE